MTGFDPYAVLGVERDASPAEIKRAYRGRAVEVHPDKPGGSAEAFGRAQRAYDILTDPDRRARFDATGNADDVQPDNALASAMQIISSYFTEIVMQATEAGQDVTQIDLIANGIKQIGAQLGEAKAAKDKAMGHIVQLNHIRAKLRQKNRANKDLLDSALQWQAEQIRVQLEKLKPDMKALEDAIEILKGYDFEVTPKQGMSQIINSRGQSTGTSYSGL